MLLKRILVIDDESGMRHMLRLVLERAGYQVVEADSAEQALTLLQGEQLDLALCDIRMPGQDGLSFLQECARRDIFTTVIMMSAFGSVDTAIECLKAGAYDYISKPFKPDEVVLTIRKAEERLRLLRENATLREELEQAGMDRSLIFQSEVMSQLMKTVRSVAPSTSSVLVSGETGTGKELIARALHEGGPRRKGPFVAVNCSAIATNLLESELFGHARGAFTGADRARDGLFQTASGGTLFLDEIGELPLELQPKLLRVIQEGEVRRVGDTQPRRVDVRVVAATARNLLDEVEKGAFRDDLYYRLAVVEIVAPALRDRLDDVPLLAKHFIDRIARRERRPAPRLSMDARTMLQQYRWPGNVRELENFMEKLMIFCREPVIEAGMLPWEIRRQPRGREDDISLKEAIARLEREYIQRALALTTGNRTKAAALLEISLRTLHYKIKDLGL